MSKIIDAAYGADGGLLVLHLEPDSERTEFFTGDEFFLQVGRLCFDEGQEVRKHRHLSAERRVPYSAEVLIVSSGRLEYTVWDYANPSNQIRQGVAEAGQILVFGKVAHSFRSLTDTKIIEVKQGPYLGERDKEFPAD